MESQTGVSEHSRQAILEPGPAAGVQAQAEAGEVGQGRALHAVDVEVRREQEEAHTEEDVGHQRRLMESEGRGLKDGVEYFSYSSFSFVEMIGVVTENSRKVQCVSFRVVVVHQIVLNPLDCGDKTVADVTFHNYLDNLQKAVGTQ